MFSRSHFSSPLKSQGLSLIEVMLVMGIMAILMVAAFVVYPHVRTTALSRQTAETYTMAWSLVSQGKSVAQIKEWVEQHPVLRQSAWIVEQDQRTSRVELALNNDDPMLCEALARELMNRSILEAHGAGVEVNGERVYANNTVLPCNQPANRVALVTADAVPGKKPAAALPAEAPLETKPSVDVDIYSQPTSNKRETWNNAGGY